MCAEQDEQLLCRVRHPEQGLDVLAGVRLALLQRSSWSWARGVLAIGSAVVTPAQRSARNRARRGPGGAAS